MRNTQAAIILCLAYVIGLLITFDPMLRWGLIIVAIPVTLILPRFWPHPKWQLLLVATAMAGRTQPLGLAQPLCLFGGRRALTQAHCPTPSRKYQVNTIMIERISIFNAIAEGRSAGPILKKDWT